MATRDPVEETYTEAETEVRREAALKRMLVTPHKPHETLAKRGQSEDQPRRSRKKPD